MDRIYIDGLCTDMQNRLAEAGSLPDHYSTSLDIVSRTIRELHQHVCASGFADDAEEIFFFKDLKPRFYHWYIFLVERQNVLKGLSVGTEHMARDYYLRELSFVQRFVDQNAFVYHYFLEGEDSRDGDFFLRRNFDPVLGSASLLFPDFSTNHDYTFSKILAYEKLQEFLVARLRATYVAEAGTIAAELRSVKKRTWTDDKIKLVELAYGIYFMGSVDFGKADISGIISSLEDSFNIHLGVAYRRFVEISRRKSGSHTSYLDAMRAEISRRITEKDRYRPLSFTKDPPENSGKNR